MERETVKEKKIEKERKEYIERAKRDREKFLEKKGEILRK